MTQGSWQDLCISPWNYRATCVDCVPVPASAFCGAGWRSKRKLLERDWEKDLVINMRVPWPSCSLHTTVLCCWEGRRVFGSGALEVGVAVWSICLLETHFESKLGMLSERFSRIAVRVWWAVLQYRWSKNIPWIVPQDLLKQFICPTQPLMLRLLCCSWCQSWCERDPEKSL